MGSDDEKVSKCYWKSGWCKKKDGFFNNKKRWIQLRHYWAYYFEKEQSGYNWCSTTAPSKEEEKSMMDGLPSMPGMPKMPGLPDMPKIDMPKIDMPKVSMPKVSAPSISAPSLSAPSLSAPKIGMKKKKERLDGGAWGYVQLYGGAKVSQKGKAVTISNASVVEIFKGETEEKDNGTWKLTAESDDEAKSWYESFAYGGAEKQE